VANIVVWIVWVAAAFACLGSGIAVVSFRNPFYSALALIGNLGTLAVLYLLLSAEFVAAAQVLVYAGAVMVMFLFVIAYLGGEADAPFHGGTSWQTIGAIAAAAAILVEVIVAVASQGGGRLSHSPELRSSFGSPDHLLAFEVTSIVLLAAAVGGVILGHHSRTLDEGGEPLPVGPERVDARA
jgi:NADH-quinone oxidoreductase subunit J